jgi:hypothetical protein
MDFRPTPTDDQQAVLAMGDTSGERWDADDSPFRAARDGFISQIQTDPTLSPEQRSYWASFSRKKVGQLKSVLHLYFGVPPTDGFNLSFSF